MEALNGIRYAAIVGVTMLICISNEYGEDFSKILLMLSIRQNKVALEDPIKAIRYKICGYQRDYKKDRKKINIHVL